MPWDGTCTAKEWKALLEKHKGGQFKYEVGLQRLQTLDKDFAGPPSAGADVTFSMIAVSLASSRFGTLTA